jgi:MGT family glycosyltransferase
LSGERPLVYVTEGTAHVQEPILLKAAVKALADLPVQVVMTTGKNRDPSALDLGAIPPNVRVERWVPQSRLLPHASLVLNQGGSGTSLAALQEGLPQVLVPVWWDQFENARRVVESGAGLWLKPGHCTPDRLRAVTERVLGGPAFREKAKTMAAALARHGGAEEAADLIANLNSGKIP